MDKIQLPRCLYYILQHMQVSSLLISEQLREKIRGDLAQENLRVEEKLLVRRYITTCLIYRNAHRPGAITNMTLAEWEARTTSGMMVL